MVEEDQLYVDKMFRTELEVTSVDEIAVWMRDTKRSDEDSKGSVYPHEMFDENVEAGRFKRIDHFLRDSVPEEFEGNDPLSW